MHFGEGVQTAMSGQDLPWGEAQHLVLFHQGIEFLATE